MSANSLASVIKFHRQKACLSRIQLAELAGVGKTVIYEIENGKETVRWATLQSVLSALNISVKFESPLMELYEKSHRETL